MTEEKTKKEAKPLHRNWVFWVFVGIIVFIIAIAQANKAPEASDYIGQDAKQAYEELVANEYEVKFVFDRKNNGGFTDEGAQEFIIGEIKSDSYIDMPFVITKQENKGKKVTLYVDYASAVNTVQEAEKKKEALETKLGSVEAMTACEQYGKRNHREFKLHSILGKITEEAKDDNTWFMKYKVDADGYENLTMECSVTGTTANPEVISFIVY